MNSFEVHSNENACRKSGRLGLEQVIVNPDQRECIPLYLWYTPSFLKNYIMEALMCLSTDLK